MDNASDVDIQVLIALKCCTHVIDLSHVLGQLMLTYFEYAHSKIPCTEKNFLL